MSRKIVLFSTLQSTIQEKEVNANTKAELVAELSNQGVLTTDMDLIIKETGNALVLDSEVLPRDMGLAADGVTVTHDFTLFLSATKTKSGFGVDYKF